MHSAANQNGSGLRYYKTIEVKEHTQLERAQYYKLLTFGSTENLSPWLQCRLVNLAFTRILLSKTNMKNVSTKAQSQRKVLRPPNCLKNLRSPNIDNTK